MTMKTKLSFADFLEQTERTKQTPVKEKTPAPTITAVPEYRSTEPNTNNNIEKPDNIQHTISESTGVPQYRSTTAVEKLQPKSAVIPDEKFYRKANEASDDLDRSLSPAESRVLDHLMRLSVGFNRNWCQVRVSVLQVRTGYRSDKTVRAALHGLVLKRVIARRTNHNDPAGDRYEILGYSGNQLPEYRSTAAENTAVLESKFTGQLNTYTKTQKNDDDARASSDVEAFNGLIEAIQRVSQELTGKSLGRGDRARLDELAELLVAELRIAATRTESVSNVPAFLTEHLRRRLWKRDKEELQAEANKPETQAPTAKLTKEQIKSCPDCGGSGFCYPNGYDGGVVKCRHESLAKL